MGANVEMEGGATTYLNVVDVTEPPTVVTLMVTVPAVCAGLVTTSVVATSDVTLVAGLAPKATAVAPLRWVPLMVTTVPPVVYPVVGANVVMVGGGWTYLNFAVDVTEPPAVVTMMATVPAVSAGLVTTSCVKVSDVTLAAGLAPNVTAVAPAKWVPLMVTTVPPVVGPRPGRMWRSSGPRRSTGTCPVLSPSPRPS